MSEEKHSYAQLLINQKRYKEAETTLKECISLDLHDTSALRLLAICYLEQDKTKEALEIAQNALSLSPSDPWLMYVNAFCLHVLDKDDEAEELIKQAVNIDPYESEYFALWSSIHLGKKQYETALEYAEKGLEIYAENLACLNARSKALIKLGRSEEAFDTVDKALEKDPENSFTHTNKGWGLLERGDHNQALEHFREALRIDPNNDYAKSGLVNALKAKNIIFRGFLKYQFWLSNLDTRAQWGFILGAYFGTRFLRVIAEKTPSIGFILWPAVGLLWFLAFSTWIINPISNLFLRLNRFGKYALDKWEILSSNLVGISVLIGIVGGLGFLLTNIVTLAYLGIFGITMMIPLSSMLIPVETKKNYTLVYYSIVIGLIGIAALIGHSLGYTIEENLGLAYLLGIFGYQWAANYVLSR